MPTSTSASTGLVKQTGASEGFYRRNWQGGQTREQRVLNSSAVLNPPAMEATPTSGIHRPAITVSTDLPLPFESLESAMDVSPAMDETGIHRHRSFSAPVRPETMHRAASDTASTSPLRSGILRPPGELGQSPDATAPPTAADATPTAPPNTTTTLPGNESGGDDPHFVQAHPLTIATRKRLEAAVQRGHSIDQQQQQLHRSRDDKSQPPSLVTSFCYAGMEVIMASVSSSSSSSSSIHKDPDDPQASSSLAVYCMCARTRLVFQQLDLQYPTLSPGTDSDTHASTHSVMGATIQSLQSHPVTGQVCVALSTGFMWTFHPVETNTLHECFGQFRWLPGPIIDSTRTFYDPPTHKGHKSSGNEINEPTRPQWNVSLAGDGKVLVSHRDQVAVFDGMPRHLSEFGKVRQGTLRSAVLPRSNTAGSGTLADLIWTMQLPGHVVMAKISGDGHAIAVVMKREQSETEDEDDRKAATDGVHTFERDVEDGSVAADMVASASSTGAASQPVDGQYRPSLVRHASQGILYKPGPFLVHSAPVTRLEFRGYGTVTSKSPTDAALQPGQGNDLLLTYCNGDCTARIYGQNSWNPLTEWTTSPQTRVEWVKCISAFSLGDLESIKKSSPLTRRRDGTNQSSILNGEGVGGSTAPDSPNALSKRLHFSSMPNVTSSSSSHAGAWVVELSFHGPYPALRLFRLAYLERGVDDLNPTLLESISSYLPLNCLWGDRILALDDHGNDGSSLLSIEGVWPAWNTWLSESTDLSTTETVSGSAMTSLGLSSGPAMGINGSMAGTPNPPSEVRIVSSHIDAGLVSVLDFPVFGDKGLTLFELGNPVRNILSIQHLSNCRLVPTSSIRKPRQRPRIWASLTYESSRLVAELDKNDCHSVRIFWRKAGTSSFLPSKWLPDDVDPPKAMALLQNNSNNLRDESLMPTPISLPSVHIPTNLLSADQSISALLWWPDAATFCGSPFLVAIMSDGTVVVFEIPPPSSSLEPPLPKYDKPPSPPTMTFDMNGFTFSRSFYDDEADQPGQEYDVSILSDPEYGLGLRLESQPDGMCAIAGSFKKHPLNGDTLPAEKSGMIRLGDELLSANETDLKDMSFDDIVTAVREVGSTCGPGNPIRLKFRRSSLSFGRKSSFGSGSAYHRGHGSQISDTSSRNRRTMEQMLGVNPEDMTRHANSGAGRHLKGHGSVETTNTKLLIQKPSPQSVHIVSSVAGIFPNAISIEDNSPADIKTSLALVEWNPDQYHAVPKANCRNALLFWSKGNTLMVTQLAIGSNSEMERTECFLLCEHSLGSSGLSLDGVIRAVHVAERDNSGFIIAVATQSGQVYIVSLILDVQGKSNTVCKSHPAFRLEKPWSRGCDLQISSSELLATMQPNVEGVCTSITLWSSCPRSGCRLDQTLQSTEESEYYPTNVNTEYSPDGDEFLEYCIVSSGYLDAYPSLVSYSRKYITIFQKRCGHPDWLPSAQILYSTSSWASLSPSSAELMEMLELPCDLFPHLLPGLLSVTESLDETLFLRSDWHPDALIANVCTDSRGAKEALTDGVYSVLNWLCCEGREISEDQAERSLIVSSVSLHGSKTGNAPVESKRFNLMDVLTTPQSESASSLSSQKLQSEIMAHLSSNNTVAEQSYRLNNSDELPSVLRSMERDDLCLLWAIIELNRNPPYFGTADRSGQLFLFSSAIFLKSTEIVERLSQQHETASVLSVARRISLTSTAASEPETIASAGALGALVSTSQTQILKSCRRTVQKMTWRFARQHRVAFWERSDQVLAQIAEEIGQTIFRDTRDSMESALFFVVARKTRTLRNLAATDQSETGCKFSKFLLAHDFSSERGRRAAEKNAFSLLRKCRYGVAAAFFLLADPPFLNSALETIATKMQDSDLAFLVARLMENTELDCAANMSTRLNSSGAGYAVGPSQDTENDAPDEKLIAWEPKLGVEAHRLVVDRILPASANDNAMVALLLVWLGKNEEAAWFLSGHVGIRFAGLTEYRDVQDVSQGLFHRLMKPPRHERIVGALFSPIQKANALIDFTSAIILLETLCGSSRVRAATSLSVARALRARGVELPATRALITFIDLVDVDDKENKNFVSVSSEIQESGALSKSPAIKGSTLCETTARDNKINDECSSPRRSPGSVFSTEVLGSKIAAGRPSIFDEFNVRQSTPQTTEVQSSIFDDFDMKPPVQQNLLSSAATEPSIVVVVDVPLPTQKTSTPLPASSSISMADDVQSFIFCAPHVQNASTTPESTFAVTTTCDVQSSIFDAFEVPPQTTKTTTPLTTSSMTTSCELKSFAASNGGMHSSIFDDFDVPFAKRDFMSSDIMSISRAQGVGSRVEGGQDEASQMKVKCSIQPLLAVPTKANISLVIEKQPTPLLWTEWRNDVLLDVLARRLLRVIASVISSFQGELVEAPISDFYKFHERMLVPKASEVLQLPCDPERFLGLIRQSLDELSNAGKLDSLSLIRRSVSLLDSRHNHRVLFSVLLYAAAKRADLGEAVVRICANTVVSRCHSFSLARDELTQKSRTRAYVSSQFCRREAVQLSWQLEACLWFHRGGGLALSGVAFNEAVVAVRVGLLLASWNMNFKCMEALIQSDPDCLMDECAGRQLWTSLKIVDASNIDVASNKASSGGWEFLVNCKRSQATELLRDRATGCFIIRPHVDDLGVFTLSFKTNLRPDLAEMKGESGRESESRTPDTSGDELDADIVVPKRKEKKVRKEDVVQHAIIRLSDSGFRCGSFGPFTSLITLLEAVSSSLPFSLRFDLPPKNRVIFEDGSQTSPNAILFRKLSLRPSESFKAKLNEDIYGKVTGDIPTFGENVNSLGVFTQLVVACRIRRQLSSVASFVYDDEPDKSASIKRATAESQERSQCNSKTQCYNQFSMRSRLVGPLLSWCRSMETALIHKLAPDLDRVSRSPGSLSENETESSDNVTESSDAIEVSTLHSARYVDGSDAILRGMIQQGSGVEFSTLRLIDSGECTMLVLFNRKEAVRWLVSSGIEQTDETAVARLDVMERDRVIETIDLSLLPLKQKSVDFDQEGVRYRFIDPWEVEALSNREGETRSASLGRGRFVGFSLGQVSLATDHHLRELGGDELLELWTSARCGILLTKALATVHPPWERAASGDLHVTKGKVSEPPPLMSSIRRCLYRNTLFRKLDLPQRFLALVQVELLDLKNLTSPGGSLSLKAYALLRLKRVGSGGTLTNKARTLDSAATAPVKLNKTSGPNAPASWGSVVRFRFPLPEDASVDGASYDRDRDSLFKGPPRVLQVSVYEKKLLADHALGTADISTDSLSAGGQVEEWVPLRSEKRGITWFARIRLTLRFELMCIASAGQVNKESVPSVGLQRIYELNQSGGSAHEDIQKRSMSSPDLLSYFEGIVY